MEEVRVRMPMRFLRGKLVEPSSRTTAPVMFFPTISNAAALAPALERFSRQGRRVIVDSDGDVFAEDGQLIQADPLLPWLPVPASPARAAQWRATYLQMVHSADAVTVATPYLADVYREAGAKQVFVCPNAVDPEQWPEEPWRDTDEAFAVGFAGGPGHLDDLELIRPALEWASRKANVEAVIFGGFYSPAPHLPLGLQAPPDVPPTWQGFAWRHVPFTPSYERYRATLTGLLDLGLMPLAQSPFNRFSRGRSDLKVCELAMAGALPVVSDAPNYEAWRETPVLFARGAGEFLEHVQWAAAHPGEVRERAVAVREIVLAKRAFPAAVKPWRAALAELATPAEAWA